MRTKLERSFLRLFFVALLILCCETCLRAQRTIHVPGDQATIQAGIDAAQNGDTVLVAPGTYYENLYFNGKAITLTSAAGSATTVIDGGSGKPTITFSAGESRSSILSGFTITHGYGIFIYESNPTIQTNFIDGTNCHAFFVESAAPLIEANRITHTRVKDDPTCQTANGSALFFFGLWPQSATVLGNTIEENTDSGVNPETDLVGGGAAISARLGANVVVAKNIIRNNTAAGTNSKGGGILMGDGASGLIFGNLIYGNTAQLEGGGIAIVHTSSAISEVEVDNNTVVDNNVVFSSIPGFGNPASGVAVAVESPDLVDLRNNILTATSPGAAVSCDSATSNIIFQHNDIYNPIGPTVKVGVGCDFTPGVEGNFSEDPGFVNASSFEFQLLASSPAVDAGDNKWLTFADAALTSDAATDLAGNPRVVNATGKPSAIVDLGAYELQQESGATTSLALASSSNPSQVGRTVAFTATVTSADATPTGTVTFADGTTVLATQPLSSGSASFSTAALSIGTHLITATYNPTGAFNGSTNHLTESVIAEATSTNVSVTPNPGSAFATLLFTAVVSSASGAPTGTVTFSAGGHTVATAAVGPNGMASTSSAALGGGSFAVVATYSGDTTFAPSTSSPVSVVLSAVSSTVTLTASPNPSAAGQPILFTVSVKGVPGEAVPSGTITLREGSGVLGSALLNAGATASFSIASLSAGVHAITATYGGDTNYLAGVASVQESVLLTGTATSLSTSPNPSYAGQNVTLTATTRAGGAPADGTVTFYDGSTPLATELTSNGSATYSTALLAVGQHSLTASFASSETLAGSVSSPVTQTVLASGFRLSLSPASFSIPSGQSGATTVQLASLGTFAGPLALTSGPLPAHAAGVFGTTTVVLAPGGNGSTAFTLSTLDLGGATNIVGQHSPSGLAANMSTFTLPFLLWARRRRRVTLRQAGSLFILGTLLGTAGCGQIGSPLATVQPGMYTIAITATDANHVVQTALLNVTVTQ